MDLQQSAIRSPRRVSAVRSRPPHRPVHAVAVAPVDGAVRTHPVLSTLDERGLAQLVAAGRVSKLRPRRTIVREGTAAHEVFFLLEGLVRLSQRADSDELLAALIPAPGVFGCNELFSGGPALESASTLEYCTVLRVPRHVVLALVRTCPAFAEAMLATLADRLRRAHLEQRQLAFVTVEGRLARLFLRYAEVTGVRSDQGVRISVPLSQSAMARDLAVSRTAVGLALTKLKSNGLVSKHDARYVILDLQAMQDRAA